jgi:hypothetical protein
MVSALELHAKLRGRDKRPTAFQKTHAFLLQTISDIPLKLEALALLDGLESTDLCFLVIEFLLSYRQYPRSL